MVFKGEHSTNENASFMVLEFAGCAEILFIIHQMAVFLGWLPEVTYPTHKRSEIHVHDGCINSILCVCVCDAQLCSIKKTTMTLCVFMAFSKPGRLRAMMMLLGSGVGVLPFTVNPVTPTGSTNCDTGTITLYCFTFKDSH